MYAPGSSRKCPDVSGMSELFCVPSAIPAGERLKHFALARRLFSARALERRDLPDGYLIRFPQDDFEAVARFVANERLCCPFLQFEVRVAQESGSLWLQMTGPPGTREVLEAELSLTQSCHCASPVSASQGVAKWSTLAGLFGAIAVCTACCLVPFALVSIGIAGPWLGSLQALTRYKWLFILMTVAFLAYGFHAAYWRGTRTAGAASAVRSGRSEQALRVWLWIATLLAVSGVVFERIEPLLRK